MRRRLGRCGSTIVTRLHTRDVVLSFPIDKENQARRLEKELKMSPTEPGGWEASASALVRWAGADAERLTLAAESLLLARARGSQEISGFSLASMDLSWRSLRFSGVPPSQWLETPATRRTIAIYNAALDRFVAIHGNDLARGGDDNFWIPLGVIEVSTEFVANPPYRAGYFDTFIWPTTSVFEEWAKESEQVAWVWPWWVCASERPSVKRRCSINRQGEAFTHHLRRLRNLIRAGSRSSHPIDRSKP